MYHSFCKAANDTYSFFEFITFHPGLDQGGIQEIYIENSENKHYKKVIIRNDKHKCGLPVIYLKKKLRLWVQAWKRLSRKKNMSFLYFTSLLILFDKTIDTFMNFDVNENNKL